MRDTTRKSKPAEVLPDLKLTLPAAVATSLQELLHTVGKSQPRIGEARRFTTWGSDCSRRDRTRLL